MIGMTVIANLDKQPNLNPRAQAVTAVTCIGRLWVQRDDRPNVEIVFERASLTCRRDGQRSERDVYIGVDGPEIIISLNLTGAAPVVWLRPGPSSFWPPQLAASPQLNLFYQ